METAVKRKYSDFEYDISFDKENGLYQSQEYFLATIDGKRQKIKVQDYATLYSHPFLYETLLHDLLGCKSATLVADLLAEVQKAGQFPKTPLRALEIGAGSGAFGQQLKTKLKPELLMGLDLTPEAKIAAERDRPKLYNQYLIADLTRLTPEMKAYLKECRFNFTGAVAAAGDGHIPVAAYEATFQLLEKGGIFLLHIRPSTYDATSVELCGWVQAKIADRKLEVLRNESVFHRKAVDGRDIHYTVIVGVKQ